MLTFEVYQLNRGLISRLTARDSVVAVHRYITLQGLGDDPYIRPPQEGEVSPQEPNGYSMPPPKHLVHCLNKRSGFSTGTKEHNRLLTVLEGIVIDGDEIPGKYVQPAAIWHGCHRVIKPQQFTQIASCTMFH